MIFKKKPPIKPKKKPELSKIIIPPGNEKVKYNVEIIKNKQMKKYNKYWQIHSNLSKN